MERDQDPDIERVLREGMDRFTADTRVPAGLVASARRRVHNRRVAAGAVLTVGTAAVTAAAVIAVTVPGTRPGTGRVTNTQTAGYLVKQVQGALAVANFVVHGEGAGTQTFPLGGRRVRDSLGQTSSWTYGNTSRMEEFSGSGCGHARRNGDCTHRGGSGPYLAAGTAVIGGKPTGAYVTYYDHKYSLSPPGNHVRPCSVTAQLVLGGPAVAVAGWPAFLKATLDCQHAIVTGRVRIGGQDTIVIRGSADVALPDGYRSAIHEKRAHVRYTLDVDPVTYLPVRTYAVLTTYGGPAGPVINTYVTSMQWLPPTPANIARAQVTIPPGYQRVSSLKAQQ